jgi:hypothetical protein
MKCMHCKFYKPIGNENPRHECSSGECHRFPPKPYLSTGDTTHDPIVVEWPPVFDYDFCGEYEFRGYL